jgi:hypothetical protein
MQMFTIAGASPECVPMPPRQLAEPGILEPTHLERGSSTTPKFSATMSQSSPRW